MLLVGNGKTLTFVDYEVGQKSSWPICQVAAVGAAVGQARPRPHRPDRAVDRPARPRGPRPRCPPSGVRDADPRLRPSPAAPGGLLLQGWTAIDAQNKRTTVPLDGQRYNVAVPESAFTFAEPKKRLRR